MHSRKSYLLALFFCMAAAVIPFFVTEFIPVTDLSHHLNQTRIFYQAFYNGSNEYDIHYTGPNTIVYHLLFFLWHFFPPLLVGKLALVILLQAGILTVFLIAYSENCRPSQAVAAVCFLFNTTLYWGFMPFMSGWPVFGLFWLWTRKSHEASSSGFLFQGLLLSFFLCWSHVLWLLGAFAWLAYQSVRSCLKGETIWVQRYFLPFLPALFFSLVWFVQLWKTKTERNIVFTSTDVFSIIDKLHPVYFETYSNAPLQGHWPDLVLIMPVFAVVFNFLRGRNQFKPELLAAGVIAFVFSVASPYLFANTVLFAQRWLPYAIIFVILSLSLDEKNETGRLSFSLLILTVFLLAQAHFWVAFEKNELSGWNDCLKSVPAKSKVIYVDQKRSSQYFHSNPFWQFVGYFELLSDCKTNFSFAYHDNGIVRFKDKQKILRQKSYINISELTEGSIHEFDHLVLCSKAEDKERLMLRFPFLRPIFSSGLWHTFKIKK